ncbi:S8 family serine peptidase, partial [Prauserella halophila]|uniref:S8 family serine peptidase n=1 Tax=Prauserella halophila TaxID=185641 RepID=UPI0031E36A39
MRSVGPHAAGSRSAGRFDTGSRTGVRRSGPARRISAVLLTAALGATTAMIPALPAAAQSDDWTPPADAGLPPVGQLKLDGPNEHYERNTECVTAAELDEADRLRQAPWGQMYLRLDEAHRILAAENKQPGAGETVTVIDTGVEDGHPYMRGADGKSRVTGVGEYVAEDAGPGVRDCDGHGTEVAGIIGANTPPDIGFQGVAPHVQINAIRQSSQYYEKSDEPEQPQNPGGDGDGDGGGGDGDGSGDGG